MSLAQFGTTARAIALARAVVKGSLMVTVGSTVGVLTRHTATGVPLRPSSAKPGRAVKSGR